MSEVDGPGSLGKNSGEMGPCLWLAQRIIDDVNGLRPSAWVIWLVVDRHYSDFDAKERGYAEPRLKYWGTAVADHFSKRLIIGKRYYAFGQFTRFIRPGDRIVGSSDFSVAAINPKQNKIVIVALNAEESGKRVSFDLSAFRNPGTKAKAVRTSGPWNAGENWTEIDPVPVKNKRLDVVLAPYSITSFVVRGDEPLLTD